MHRKEKQSQRNDELLSCHFKLKLTSLYNRLVNKQNI